MRETRTARISCATLLLLWMFQAGATNAQTQAPSGMKIIVLEGEGAINNVRLQRAKEPVVQVVDESNAPVKDASVTFLVPDSGASGVFGASGATYTVLTDEKGQATGRGLRPNRAPGQFQIRVIASYRGQTARAAITQTNAEPVGAASKGSSKKYLWFVLVGGAAAGGAFAAKGGSKSQGAPVPQPGAVIVPGTPVFQPPH